MGPGDAGEAEQGSDEDEDRRDPEPEPHREASRVGEDVVLHRA